MEKWREWRGRNWVEVLTVGAIVIVLSTTIGGTYLRLEAKDNERLEWENFRKTHGCTVVGEVAASYRTTIATGISSSGNMVVTPLVAEQPKRTGYLCDDGVTYWRE